MLKTRIFGYVASLFLTGTSFLIIASPEFFHIDIKTAIIIILILAVLQFLVQSVCFIHIWREKGPPWNASIFLTTLSIVITIIFFSIWIMHHLNYNMMPR